MGGSVGPIAGGTSEGEVPTEDDLEVWHDAQDNDSSLTDLEDPVQVKKQVVAGTLYTFTFGDDTEVKVLHQPWVGPPKVAK
eukprot:CAMPEP_0197652616 /NCGR_PEP_ID=MMETSP1338-20131121/34561_1 /TAXON_ID=43686 ORGANISM="Pelagodinium beii, Strain RCC1491" /NCGR_SAMPLE_ID=MMETSP1338 /ASSEMBLY_ACC=CAM_ASM_000754 /LENGTH=80 /DNA_ID=CAMNT_0043227533 /DNA_START=79 /DNA_END=321 /DNA_ORIENTATION=-